MKKLLLIFILVLIIMFLSCDNEDVENKNPLIGTWEDTWESDSGDLCFDRFIFGETEVTRNSQYFHYIYTADFQKTKEEYKENLYGTYQYDKSTITFNFEDQEPWTVVYSINGKELTLIIRENEFKYKKVN